MPKRLLPSTWLTALAATTALATLVAVPAATARPGRGRPSGGAAINGHAPSGGLAPTQASRRHRHQTIAHTPSRSAKGTWLKGVTITEYWPAPEAWFVGKPVSAPGLSGKHRIDWLYSATGVSMQGEGLGLDGQMYHIDALGSGGWVTSKGGATDPGDGWAGGSPFWRAGGFWRSALGAVTFPLAAGGWYAGQGRRYVPLPGVTFAPGPSLPLHFYQSVAVDPRLIPLGSRVYIPAYRLDGHGGWFVAQDTGGGILGRHIDVYRTPPASPQDGGNYLTGQPVYVIKARAAS